MQPMFLAGSALKVCCAFAECIQRLARPSDCGGLCSLCRHRFPASWRSCGAFHHLQRASQLCFHRLRVWSSRTWYTVLPVRMLARLLDHSFGRYDRSVACQRLVCVQWHSSCARAKQKCSCQAGGLSIAQSHSWGCCITSEQTAMQTTCYLMGSIFVSDMPCYAMCMASML